MAETDDQQYGISRLVAFCDGVFAFAITLLITTIPFSLGDLPSSATNAQILPQLGTLLPGFYAYVLSFYMVGNYWLVHHRMFRQIIKYDATLLWLNLTLLLFIAFLPVPTAFLGRYGDNSVITALYALTQTVITLIYLVIGWYTSSHHRLIPPSLDEKTLRYAHWRSFITVSMFALSIGLAFLNPQLAKLSWIAIFIVRPLILKKYIQQEPGVTPPLSG
ncbi:MAG: TMEM175 family protein [Chloroflexota bacterium]|nr:TMEM175 family protein [Chloroflexota bacterium]